MTKKITPQELIDETIQYYTTHPRAISPAGHCAYFDPQTKNMCAVGRCAIDPQRMENISSKHHGLDVGYFIHKGLYQFIKPQYSTIPMQLWRKLQNWHDDGVSPFWTEDGTLTNDGINRLEELKKQYPDET